jgi:hypothetical protein
MKPRHTLVPLALTLAAVTLACGGDDPSTATDETATAPAETTTSLQEDTTTTTEDLPGEQIFVFDLGTGECFDERLVAGQGPVPVDELFRVPCEGPHQNEVYLLTTMPQATGDDYPGEDAVRGFADSACLESFEDFIGAQYELSEFEIAHIVPTESSWPRPDREVVCFVFDRSADFSEGSAQGAAR